MNLDKINNCLAFYFQWSNEKNDSEKFAELDKQLEAVTRDFFSELTGNQKFFSWMRYHYYFKDTKEYMSTMATVGDSMIKNAKAKLICFEDDKKVESYIFKSMKGKANLRMREGNSATDILTHRTKAAEEKKKKKLAEDESAVKEFDNRIDKVINEENENSEIESRPSEESISDYDEDGNEITGEFTSIENFGDPSESERQELNTLRTDLSLFNNSVAFLLALIYKDLSEEDMVLEKKIAWQIGTNYEGLLYEKVGLFTDPILIAHDIATIVRYEHWQTVK